MQVYPRSHFFERCSSDSVPGQLPCSHFHCMFTITRSHCTADCIDPSLLFCSSRWQHLSGVEGEDINLFDCVLWVAACGATYVNVHTLTSACGATSVNVHTLISAGGPHTLMFTPWTNLHAVVGFLLHMMPWFFARLTDKNIQESKKVGIGHGDLLTMRCLCVLWRCYCLCLYDLPTPLPPTPTPFPAPHCLSACESQSQHFLLDVDQSNLNFPRTSVHENYFACSLTLMHETSLL